MSIKVNFSFSIDIHGLLKCLVFDGIQMQHSYLSDQQHLNYIRHKNGSRNPIKANTAMMHTCSDVYMLPHTQYRQCITRKTWHHTALQHYLKTQKNSNEIRILCLQESQVTSNSWVKLNNTIFCSFLIFHASLSCCFGASNKIRACLVHLSYFFIT